MTLDTLLSKAFVKQAHRDWFHGTELHANLLLVPDRKLGEALGRMFGPTLRTIIPDLKIQVAAKKPPPATPRTFNSCLRDERPEQGDML